MWLDLWKKEDIIFDKREFLDLFDWAIVFTIDIGHWNQTFF